MKIKGLDYIRVLGILLVIFYHFFPHLIPGGFLGVNILFVLSGFLISYHLIDEIYDNHKIDFKRFYFKRYVRIVPAILLMLFVTSLFAYTINRDYTVHYFDQFISTFSFMTNYYEIITGGSYEAQFIEHLFLHTWSLAIEVHFYLIWPLVISLIYKRTQSNRPSKKKFSTIFMNACLAIYVFCYLLTLVLTFIKSVDTAFVYFFDITRLTSFAFGSLLGAFVKRFSYNKIPYNKATIIGSLILVGMSVIFTYESKLTYVLGFLVTDIITGFLILVAYSNPKLHEDYRMVKLSEYSYGIFVFHWPIYVIFKSMTSPRLALILTFLVAGGFVYFNHNVFEPLFVDKRHSFLTKNISPKSFQIGLCTMVFLSFLLAININNSSAEMISLEKKILVESINQDVDKIKRDKESLDEYIKKENMPQNEVLDDNISTENEQNDPFITMLGDSVVLGPRGYFEENIPNLYINAEGSRNLELAPDIIRQMNAEGTLGEIVILELGTNAEIDPNISLPQIIEALPDGKRLIFITSFDNRFDQPHRVSRAMKKIAPKYDFITLMPWEDEAIAHPEYYTDTDGVHFYGKWNTYSAYLKMLEDAIAEAKTKPAKGE